MKDYLSAGSQTVAEQEDWLREYKKREAADQEFYFVIVEYKDDRPVGVVRFHDIDDEGVIKIASIDKAAGDDAKKRIEEITADVEVGKIYEGKVVKIMDFGAFVSVLPGKDGLVHISQISNERVENVTDELTEGDIIKVKVLEIDKQGRIRLSMKAIEGE